MKLIVIVVLSSSLAMAQAREPSHDFPSALSELEKLNDAVAKETSAYKQDLARSMNLYGRGFEDPVAHINPKGFAEDIRTGDSGQTERIKLGVFGTILATSGVRLDPDPLRDWAEIERLLERSQEAIESGPPSKHGGATENLYARWYRAVERVHVLRDATDSVRPQKLAKSQTYSAHSTEGPNLQFSFFGLHLGRDMGNVGALFELTYAGATTRGHVFLLTSVLAQHTKIRTDTVVRSRSLLIYDNTEDALAFGHVVTMQDHSEYRKLGARVADVMGKLQDWAWKEVSSGDTAPISDLDQAIKRIRETVSDLRSAKRELERIALEAMRENDNALLREAVLTGKKARLPNQDLRSDPDLRSRLFLARALSAGDPRFLPAKERIRAARLRAEASISDAQGLLASFNSLPEYENASLPWDEIQKLAVLFMKTTEDTRRASLDAGETLEELAANEVPRFIVTPSLIVEQAVRNPDHDLKLFVQERVLREVHWVIKGVPSREYASELVSASMETGLHRVEAAGGPERIQGPGGIIQMFKKLSPLTQ
jgi:hypothetical protein